MGTEEKWRTTMFFLCVCCGARKEKAACTSGTVPRNKAPKSSAHLHTQRTTKEQHLEENNSEKKNWDLRLCSTNNEKYLLSSLLLFTSNSAFLCIIYTGFTWIMVQCVFFSSDIQPEVTGRRRKANDFGNKTKLWQPAFHLFGLSH